MRYRPFGRTGAAISNITLSLGADALARGPAALHELIFTALEHGVNAYRLENADPVLAEVVGQALANVDRKLVCVLLTLGLGDGRRGSSRDFSAAGMTGAIDRALHISGLGFFDVAILQEPAEDELPQASLNALKALRSTGRVRLLGVAGGGDVMDAYVSTGAFDVLASPFHVNSPWQVRSRMRSAREQDMAIFAYDYFPESLGSPRRAAASDQPKKKGLFSALARPRDNPLADAGSFAFLHQTPNWTAEAICLAYILTDPSVSSALVRAVEPARVAELAAIPERDMRPGLSAQIEMARVSAATAA